MVERLNPKCTKNCQFGNGSVIVYGTIFNQGTIPLVHLNMRVNGTIYRNLLQTHVVPMLQESICENPNFMQDNAPYDKVILVIEYLKEQNVEVMDWPSQSPALNKIQNLGNTSETRVMSRNPTNGEYL